MAEIHFFRQKHQISHPQTFESGHFFQCILYDCFWCTRSNLPTWWCFQETWQIGPGTWYRIGSKPSHGRRELRSQEGGKREPFQSIQVALECRSHFDKNCGGLFFILLSRRWDDKQFCCWNDFNGRWWGGSPIRGRLSDYHKLFFSSSTTALNSVGLLMDDDTTRFSLNGSQQVMMGRS